MNQPNIKVTVEHHFRTESESDFQRFVKDLELNVLRWICAGESAIDIVDRMKDQLTEHRNVVRDSGYCCYCPPLIQVTIA